MDFMHKIEDLSMPPHQLQAAPYAVIPSIPVSTKAINCDKITFSFVSLTYPLFAHKVVGASIGSGPENAQQKKNAI